MEEARALINQDFQAPVTQAKRRHMEIRALYLERTTDFVGDELGLEDEKLREVTVTVTDGGTDDDLGTTPDNATVTRTFTVDVRDSGILYVDSDDWSDDSSVFSLFCFSTSA